MSIDFTCHTPKRKYKKVCQTKYIIYPAVCKCSGKPYVDSATGFKERFRIHKSDISTGMIS